jgi:two-component system OmpR family sensor kinase
VTLLVAVVLLAALGLGISAVASTTALRGYLVDRVDGQLQGAVHDGGYMSTVLSGYANDHDTGRARPGRPNAFGLIYATVVRPTGGTVYQVPLPSDVAAPKLPSGSEAHLSPFTVTASGGVQWRALGIRQPFTDGTTYTVYVAVPLDEVQRTVGRLQRIELVVGVVVLALLGLVAFLLVRRSLRPLVAVESAAEAIAEGDLSQRVPESDPRTEVGSLSHSFNTMVARLESAFTEQATSEAEARASEDRMRRFVGDASHELRTPLTSIRGFAELYRSGALPAGPDVDRAMSRIEGEAARMGLLVEDLLLLARLDQQRPLEHVAVDLLELASDAVSDATAVDPSREVTLEAVAAGPPPVVTGDPARLRQVFGNLVGNALTHTPAGTPVVVRVWTASDSATVAVVDAGPGIPEGDRGRVFERFFRADASRTRASGGTGLGLSIVQALVAAHGGSVDLLDTTGGGATFQVTLPLA